MSAQIDNVALTNKVDISERLLSDTLSGCIVTILLLDLTIWLNQLLPDLEEKRNNNSLRGWKIMSTDGNKVVK